MTHAAPESARDIAEVPALEIISTAALHLMSSAAVHLGLAEDLPDHKDLDEARTLIEALAGLVIAGAPRLGHHHARRCATGCAPCSWPSARPRRSRTPPGEGPGESSPVRCHPPVAALTSHETSPPGQLRRSSPSTDEQDRPGDVDDHGVGAVLDRRLGRP